MIYRNPRISMTAFKTKMEGRSMIKISRLLSKFGTSDLQKDNWVTMGVVVHKTEPRQSANVSIILKIMVNSFIHDKKYRLVQAQTTN